MGQFVNLTVAVALTVLLYFTGKLLAAGFRYYTVKKVVFLQVNAV